MSGSCYYDEFVFVNSKQFSQRPETLLFNGNILVHCINKMLRMAYMGENGRDVNPEIDRGEKWVGFSKERCSDVL